MSVPTLQDLFAMKKETYTETIRTVAQQTKPRFASRFPVQPLQTGEAFLDGVGVLSMYVDNSIFAEPRYQEPGFFRRKITTNRVIGSVFYDERQMRKLMLDNKIEGLIKTELNNAANRAWDKTGFDAAFADVTYGLSNGSTSTITFANDGGRTITATGGFTYDDILDINAYFAKKEIGLEMGSKISFAITEQEQKDLKMQDNLINSLYPNSFSRIEGVGGFTKIENIDLITYGSDPDGYSPLLSVTGGVRDCVCIADDGLIYGVFDDLSIELIDHNINKIKTWEIRAIFEIGAVRMFGNKIIKVQTTAA